MPAAISRRQFALSSLSAAVAAASGCAGNTVAPNVNGLATDLATVYSNADATAMADLVRRGEVSAVELLDEAIQRTEFINPVINAVTMKHYELARQNAATGNLPAGPFTGVPFLLKDLGARLAGTVTTGGSRLLVDIKSPADDVLVARYKKAGFVIFGKTNTPEFGMALTTESYLHGPCRNPWNLEHSTAGSSGGSAAAVAAGIVPVAHATDGGGSIRVPAAACGVFGFKPTRALTPRGVGPSMMSVSHVVSRSVRDSAAVLDATAGYAPGLPFVSPQPVGGYVTALSGPKTPLRIALVTDEPLLKIHPDVDSAIRRTATVLQSLGHRVEPASAGINFDQLNQAQTTLILAEFAEGMESLSKAIKRPLDNTTLERLSLEFIRSGRRTSATEYVAAWNHIQSVAGQMARLFDTYDLMLSPVTVTPPPKLGLINELPDDTVESFISRFRTYSAYTPLQNLTGLPAASLPVGLSQEGLPVAAMLSAALGQDALLMGVCAQLESALPFLSARPPAYAQTYRQNLEATLKANPAEDLPGQG